MKQTIKQIIIDKLIDSIDRSIDLRDALFIISSEMQKLYRESKITSYDVPYCETLNELKVIYIKNTNRLTITYNDIVKHIRNKKIKQILNYTTL